MTKTARDDGLGGSGSLEVDRQNAELAAMQRMLDLSEGCFSLSVAVCSSPALRDYLIERLSESVRIEVVSLDRGTVDVYGVVVDQVAEKQPRALFVINLEASVPSDLEYQHTLDSLNASRELWEHRFQCPVVFWLPEYVTTLLATHARDFWRYRSHRFDFAAEQVSDDVLRMESSQSGYTAALNLSADEKRFRIAELEQRIQDAGDEPKPQLVKFVAEWHNEQGVLHQSLGNLDAAEAMYKKALEIDEQLGRREGMASDYGNLGNVYRIRGDLDAAEAMHKKALEINEQLERREGMAINYGNLGNVYRIRGDLDAAEAMYKKALEINEQLGRREGMAINYGNLGVVYRIRGDLDAAEAMYKKALEINEQLGGREGMASDYGNLGIVYQIRGDLEAAERMWRKALELFEQIGMADKVKMIQGRLDSLRGDGEP